MNPSFPQSPSLAAAERLRIGECEVDVALREVRTAGARRAVRITPKSMAVLRVLIEHRGEVVPREVLFARVWPDTWPSNDVLTQAITQLRKALGEQRGETRYIETISKTGYRLLASVDIVSSKARTTVQYQVMVPDVAACAPSPGMHASGDVDEAAAEPVLPLPAAVGWRRWLPEMRPSAWIAGLGLLMLASVLFAVGTGGWTSGAGRAKGIEGVIRAPQLPFRLLTSAPGFEGEAALSPDASQVAYIAVPEHGMESGSRIMVQTTGQSQPRLLAAAPDGAWDRLPAWSPNGREIAFVRHLPNGQCRIMGISANGGSARELLVCDGVHDPSFDWTPDSRSLIVSSRTSPVSTAGLQVYDIAAGSWHPIPYGSHARDDDHTPRYSPDGQWIAFLRNAPLGDIWRIPAAGGTPQRLTTQNADLRGLSWTPDSRGIVFGRRVDGQSRLYHLAVDTGVIRDLGVWDAKSPSVARGRGVLAFTQRRPQFGIYRLDLFPGGGDVTDGQKAEHVFASSGRDTLPSISPDGSQILFASDRSGDFGLWWAELDDEASQRRIEGIHPDSRQQANWSQDGRRALVSGVDEGGYSGLYEIQPRAGSVTRLTLPLPDQSLRSASYVPGSRRLLVLASGEDGRQQLHMLEPQGSGWRVLKTLEDVTSLKVDARHGRVFFTQTGEDGLWESGLALEPDTIRRISHEYPRSRDYRNWALTSDGHVEYLQSPYPCTVRLRHLALGRSFIRPRCLQRERRPSGNGFSIDPRNHQIYLSLATTDGADIGFMALPEAIARTPSPDPKSMFNKGKSD